jgi:hypothetical protein
MTPEEAVFNTNPLNLLADAAAMQQPLPSIGTCNTSLHNDNDAVSDGGYETIYSDDSREVSPDTNIAPDANGANAEHSKATRNYNGSTIRSYGIQPDHDVLLSVLQGKEPAAPAMPQDLVLLNKGHRAQEDNPQQRGVTFHTKKRSFFDQFAQYPELYMEVAKQMDVKSLISLYSISKDFHYTLQGHMTHVMKLCAASQFPESSRIFIFTLYNSLCMPDPVGRPHPIDPGRARQVPSLRWLSMVEHREKCVRDILALMAREGHRMPTTMSLTLKKTWLTMDIATSARRVQLMHNEEYWTDDDIYNLQFFLLKLDMRFNDPVDGPADDGMKKLFMGQRGLTPLRDCLKRTRFIEPLELIRMAVRYAYEPRPEVANLPIFGIPSDEIGRHHLEGWGLGQVHLYRMDELVLREAVRRNLGLDEHMTSMLLWGYVDPATKEDIKVSAEETYMSDDDHDHSTKDWKNKGTVVKDEKSEIENASLTVLPDEDWETDDEGM